MEMLEEQYMPSFIITLALIIAIMFIGSKKLPVNWLKNIF
jgi:hypothetical protein